MDDASADPVGTVRRTDGLIKAALVKTTSVSLPWRRLDYTLSGDGLRFENLGGFSDEQAARFPVIGAVPGTPAAAGLLAAPADDEAALRMAHELWRQDYGPGTVFPEAGQRHDLYLSKVRFALAALREGQQK